MKSSLSVTVDLEDWYHIPSVCSSPFAIYKGVDEFFKDWTGEYDFLSAPTKRALDLLDEFNVTATFFVVADTIEHYPGLIESIADRGHEIACHGLHHACKIDPKTKVPLMSPKEFDTRTLEAKKLIEKVTGSPVIGYRAPNALISGWMLNSLKKIGFMYDSSVCVNSFYNKTDSELNTVSSIPYFPMNTSLESGGHGGFVEFPWAYYDCGIKIPTGGGPMLRFLGASLMLRGLRQSLKRGHTVFYFHPLDISDASFPNVGNGRPLYWLIKGDIVEKRLRHLLNQLDGVKIICLRDYLEL